MILRSALGLALLAGLSSVAVLEEWDAPGPKPEGLASDGVHLWVADFDLGMIHAFDTATGEATGYPAPGRRPEGLAWDGTHLWAGDWDTRLIYRLAVTDTALVVVHSFPAPRGARPVGLAWDGEALWLTTWQDYYLFRIDPGTGAVLRERTLSDPFDPLYPTSAARPEDLAHDGTHLWITDWFTAQIHRLEVDSLRVVETIPSPGPSSVGLAFHDGNLWNGDTTTDRLYRLEVQGPSSVRRTSWGRWKALGTVSPR